MKLSSVWYSGVWHSAGIPTPDSDSDHIDDTVHLLKGRYGGTQLAYKGYLYTYDRTVPSTETKYWQCIVRKEFNPKCTSRLISTSGNFPAIVREPNQTRGITCLLSKPYKIIVIPLQVKIDSNHTIYHVNNAETSNPVNQCAGKHTGRPGRSEAEL